MRRLHSALVAAICGGAILCAAALLLSRSSQQTPPEVLLLEDESASDRIITTLLQGETVEVRQGHYPRDQVVPEVAEDTPYEVSGRIASLGPLDPKFQESEIGILQNGIRELEERVRVHESTGDYSPGALSAYARDKAGLEEMRAQLDVVQKGLAFYALPGDTPDIPGYTFFEKGYYLRLDGDGNRLPGPSHPPVDAPESEWLTYRKAEIEWKALPTLEGRLLYPIKLSDHPEMVAAREIKQRLRNTGAQERAYEFNSLPFEEREEIFEAWKSSRVMIRALSRDRTLDAIEQHERVQAVMRSIPMDLSGMSVNTRTLLARTSR